MARQLRPRVLAVGFGIYFAIIGIGSWQFAQSLPGPWYPADITRWVYTTYMLVAAIFLVGLAGLGLSIRASFSRQLREVDTRLGSAVRQSSREALPRRWRRRSRTRATPWTATSTSSSKA